MSTMQVERVLPAAFYENLDLIIRNEKSTRDAFHKAVTIAREYGLSDEEIGQTIKDYMKDMVPKSTLYDWTRPLLGEVRKQSNRSEESSVQIDVTKGGTEEDHLYKEEFEYVPIKHGVKIQDAINEIANSRREGVLTGTFYWKGDQPK